MEKNELIDLIEQFADSFIGITNAGHIGIGNKMINKTGVATVKGTVVQADTTTDFAFKLVDANGINAIGIVYDNGIVDGSLCKVIKKLNADVLLKDATLSTHGNWVGVSDVAGRANATLADPPAHPQHSKEVGHCEESKGADTDVLAECDLHFN